MIEKQITEHDGVTYTNIKLVKSHDAVTCLGNKRIVLKGTPCITLMTGSWKFGPQVQFKLYAQKEEGFKEEVRNGSKYNTVEIDLDLDLAEELMKEVLKEIEKIKLKK